MRPPPCRWSWPRPKPSCWCETAAARLRDVGVGVVLPPASAVAWASRLGLSIEAELPAKSRGFSLGETLEWRWDLMIGGVTLTLKDLERLASKRSPLVQHKGAWIELRPGDLRNAEKVLRPRSTAQASTTPCA